MSQGDALYGLSPVLGVFPTGLTSTFFALPRRITDKPKSELSLVTYERRSLGDSDFPRWDKSRKRLPRLHVNAEGMIENEGRQMLQVTENKKKVDNLLVADYVTFISK